MTDYAQIRSSIRSGDLLAFSHGDWKTWGGIKVNLVRIFTRSTYSHVGLAWVVGGRVFVLEAVKPKLRIFPLSLSGDFYLLPLQARWMPETEQFALDRIGVDYSELAAVVAYFDPLDTGTVSECAAYVREVLKADGIDLGPLSRPDTVVQAAQELGAAAVLVKNRG